MSLCPRGEWSSEVAMVLVLGADAGLPGPSNKELGVTSVTAGWIRTLDRAPESQGVALRGPPLSCQHVRQCGGTLLVAPSHRV